ncbi:MAG: glycosyl transferase family 2 [Phototrophicales bacterium]|nr:MAG: glycosyl transferase family 2 [Phototrophicales bacterium]
MPTVSVIIPTYCASRYLEPLIHALRTQTCPPDEIIIIDSSSSDGTAEQARALGCQVMIIPKHEFNHGGTRNRAAKAAKGDILVFMTQDALPTDEHFISRLIQPIVEGVASAAYARQTTPEDANPLEAFARQFNYPLQSHTKSRADIRRLGVKAYFFSDAASAIRRDIFWAVGGFADWVVVNEDMILCARLLQADHVIAYVAEAAVFHAHNYTLAQTFRRYFDIGVFMHQSREILIGAKSGGEGMRFARQQFQHLWQQRKYGAATRSILESGLKWVAFQIGKRSEYLPRRLNRYLSAQKAYWNAQSQR